MSFRNKVFFGILLVTLTPLIFVSIFIYIHSTKIGEKDLTLYTTQAAQTGLVKLNNTMNRSANIVTDLLSNPQLSSMLRSLNQSDDIDQSLFNQINQVSTYVSGTYAMNYDILKNILILSGKTHNTIIFAGSNENPGFYNDVKKENGKLKYFMEKSPDGSYEIYLAGGVLNVIDSSVLGEVCIHINKKYMEDIVTQATQKGEFSFVLTPDDTIALHTDSKYVGKKYTDEKVLHEVDTHEQGYKVIKIQSKDYIVTYSRSLDSGWKFVDMIPYKDVTDKSFYNTSFIFIITIAALFFAIILSRLLSAAFYQPVMTLMKAMSKVDDDHLDIRVKMPNNDEFGMLGEGFNILMDRVKTLITQVKEEQIAKKDAEMSALRAQVNPHFLYNTLNVIKCLAADNNMAGIEKVVVALVDLLRISIGNNRDLITLREEIKYAEAYINIQKYRTDKEFKFENNVGESLYPYQIPKFTLQPLIENAIIHGIRNNTTDNVISIEARLEEEKLLIEVRDNGKGISGEKQDELQKYLDNPELIRFSKVGMINISDRIKMRFGKEYGLKIYSSDNKGTSIKITIPAIKEAVSEIKQ